MTIQDIFIRNLKDFRKLRNFSQLVLAERCNSAQSYIAEIEVGNKFPSVAMIERIALALEIDSYLLFRNEPLNIDDAADFHLKHSQKEEIISKINRSVTKIINQY